MESPSFQESSTVYPKINGLIATESDLCILRIDLKTKRASPKDDFRYQVVRLKRGEQIRLGPYRFSTDCLIGQPYGSIFQFDESSRSLKPLTDQLGFDHRPLLTAGNTELPNKSPHSSDSESDAEPANPMQRDNRNLVPSNSNQTLAPEAIAELKQSGADRSALVEKLAQGSKTFAQKSAFSQEKYLRKKQKRHAPYVALLRSCARVACEMQLAKTAHASPYSSDCAGLRVDSLALLLHHADLSASARVLLFECGTRGLVAGAILERIGTAHRHTPSAAATTSTTTTTTSSTGFIVQVGAERKALGNMPQWVDSRRYDLESLYYRIALDDLDAGATLANDGKPDACGGGLLEDCPNSKKPHLVASVTETHSSEEDDGARDVQSADPPKPAAESGVQSAETASSTAPLTAPTPYSRRAAGVRCALEARRASSLVIVCRYSPPPLALARRLWRWLRPSGALVVYCERQAALVELFVALRDGCDSERAPKRASPVSAGSDETATAPTGAGADGSQEGSKKDAQTAASAAAEEGFAAVQLELSECFCREMQVLPARTHPHVPFHAFGGYLLTGIKILP